MCCVVFLLLATCFVAVLGNLFRQLTTTVKRKIATQQCLAVLRDTLIYELYTFYVHTGLSLEYNYVHY